MASGSDMAAVFGTALSSSGQVTLDVARTVRGLTFTNSAVINGKRFAFTGSGVAEETRKVPLRWSLSVSPNPARGAFSVRYDVPNQSHISVGVYDADGRLVRSLSEGEVPPGRYEARLPSGILPAGIYFLRLDTPGFRSVKKAVVAR